MGVKGLWRLVRGPVAYDHFDPQDRSDLDAADPEAARAYVEQLLVVAADDAKNVLLLATVSIATVVILVRDLGEAVAGSGSFWEGIAITAVGLLLLASGLLYAYSAEVNARRMTLARCLASNDAARAREIWAGAEHGIHKERGRLLTLGLTCMSLGALAAFAVVVRGL